MKKFIVFWVAGIMMLAAGCGQAGDKGLKLLASPADDMFKQAQALLAEGKMLEAKAIYQQIVSEHPDFKGIDEAEQALYSLNMKLILSNIQTPQTVMHEVAVGDTLGKICKQYGVTMDLVKASNGLSTDVVRVGQKLRIWTGKFSISVNKAQNVLILKSDAEIMKVYNVSTGANNSTPVGTFKIVTKLVDPVWYKAGAAIPPESPDNVLGSRWMGFDLKSYGIHGTVAPDKIGQQVTAGCVRMRNPEVEELFKIVPMGTEVTIVD
ncbi:MAG: L,D-transpeptidase family protein [Candidatus Omnitrophica bacterium]|nr:L,D-transpeptidase family protein [Candidatus Omnitrophota bacterium]